MKPDSFRRNLPDATVAARRGLTTAERARRYAAGAPKAVELLASLSTQTDEVALDYVFDFDASESVLYTSAPGPFPGRVFLLRFWRHAKDGVMYLLGYKHQGHWRDPTRCYPGSFVRYYKPNHSEHRAPEPADSSDTERRPGIAPLASREVMVELEPGMYELPKSLAMAHLNNHFVAHTFPKPPRKVVPTVGRPSVNTPIEKSIVFKDVSAQFRNLAQVDTELSGILKVMRQFPQMRLTLQGNVDGPTNMAPALYGRGPAARAFQDAPNRMSAPGSTERYGTIGQLIDARAQAIKQYLVDHDIPASRITCSRGRIFPQQQTRRSVTIIFSNR